MNGTIRTILASLYAPGEGAMPSDRGWPLVVAALRRSGVSDWEAATGALHDAGLAREALALGPEDEARSRLGRGLLTAPDAPLAGLWPSGGPAAAWSWVMRSSVGTDLPACPLDRRSSPPGCSHAPSSSPSGESPLEEGDGGTHGASVGDAPIPLRGLSPEREERQRIWVGGIGCRAPSPEARAFARRVGRLLAEAGYGLVSGGAPGCDAAFAVGANQGAGDASLAVLPCGLAARGVFGRDSAVLLSPFANGAPFSAAGAMRRNALVTSASSVLLVASARLREGGTWRAATEALRARVSVGVYVGPGAGSGASALVALGGAPVGSPGEALALVALARGLAPGEDLVGLWGELTGASDARAQRPLSFAAESVRAAGYVAGDPKNLEERHTRFRHALTPTSQTDANASLVR